MVQPLTAREAGEWVNLRRGTLLHASGCARWETVKLCLALPTAVCQGEAAPDASKRQTRTMTYIITRSERDGYSIENCFKV